MILVTDFICIDGCQSGKKSTVFFASKLFSLEGGRNQGRWGKERKVWMDKLLADRMVLSDGQTFQNSDWNTIQIGLE